MIDLDARFDLSHLGVISVTGDDSRKFLQNQFTNDIAMVTDRVSQLSGACNRQGRLLAIFRVFKHGPGYGLRIPRNILSATLDHLRRFVLRAHVELTDSSEEILGIGLAGPHADDLLRDAIVEPPADVNGVTRRDGLTIPERYRISLPSGYHSTTKSSSG